MFFSWRDTSNPEGGGAERYLEKMATGLVARGARVTIFTAAHPDAPRDEVRDQIRYVRRGSKMTVYLHGLLCLIRRVFGPIDLVVDVQNGLPFFTRLLTRKPVIVLVHHVHREQWPVVYPGLTGRIGWWIERRVSPRLYRRCQYLAVSEATKSELATLGVNPERISVVHNGTDPVLSRSEAKTANPSICVVGRLVPHKQVEHAIDVATALGEEYPDLVLRVVGDGWWAPQLHHYAASKRSGSIVVFEGHVSEERKQEIYAQSWLMLLPSLKEGWGLVVGEAGAHQTPTIAYRFAGGTTESIHDQESGLLVRDQAELQRATASLIRDDLQRERLALGAEKMAHKYSWESAQESFARLLSEVLDPENEEGRNPAKTGQS
ncbi:MAG TPA: glycosyltransferase family 4 protein [Marmoricola sp.]|nr:glycosyltransferase family 4 protein [Marmoricola sp.]